jgi:hypothetical protein
MGLEEDLHLVARLCCGWEPTGLAVLVVRQEEEVVVDMCREEEDWVQEVEEEAVMPMQAKQVTMSFNRERTVETEKFALLG